jgi:hypothetical protein
MLYVFEPFFYKTTPSKCAPTGNGIDLSDGDRRGLQLLYPSAQAQASTFTTRAEQTLERIGAGSESGLETAGRASSPYRDRVIDLLTSLVGGDG